MPQGPWDKDPSFPTLLPSCRMETVLTPTCSSSFPRAWASASLGGRTAFMAPLGFMSKPSSLEEQLLLTEGYKKVGFSPCFQRLCGWASAEDHRMLCMDLGLGRRQGESSHVAVEPRKPEAGEAGQLKREVENCGVRIQSAPSVITPTLGFECEQGGVRNLSLIWLHCKHRTPVIRHSACSEF